MDAEPHSACVLGLEENGYGIVRSLARQRVPVMGVYSEAKAFGRLSRYCASYYLDPAVHRDDEFCTRLVGSCDSGGPKPVLFPTSDRYALLLANYSEQLAGRFLYHWVSGEYLSQIIDKARMSLVCQEAGVLAPQTYIPRENDDLAARSEHFPFPCIVKPVRNFDTRFPRGMKNFVAHGRADLLQFYRANPGLQEQTIWQEVIEGDDDEIYQCTALVRASGEIGVTFCARKIRQYAPGFGSMCFGRSEWNADVVAGALKLLEFLNHRGFASLEFKRRARDGRFYFIEMNPRLPWYSALFADAGVNLPYLGYLDLTGVRAFSPPRQRDGVHWISFKRDRRWLRRTRKTRRVSLARWARSVARARSHSWWEWRDPKPFLGASLQPLRSAIGKKTGPRQKPLKAPAARLERPAR